MASLLALGIASDPMLGAVLLMVVPQALEGARRWYGPSHPLGELSCAGLILRKALNLCLETYIPRDAGRDSIINAAGWSVSASRHEIWVVSDRTFRRVFVQPIVFASYYAETFLPVRL